ncbi:MAG: hypothetical protein JJT94_01755, partial [Bernardetiaceae bacterium]|nr:hypothetical protein [Bernardetiaceae bacterium]
DLQSVQGAEEYRFLFNGGSERISQLDLHWHDTPFRSYDPQLGRFWGVDALADYFASITSYQYAYNNPIGFNDPTGLAAEEPGAPITAAGEDNNPSGEGEGGASTLSEGAGNVSQVTEKEASPIRGIITALRLAKRAYKVYKKHGKLTSKNLKKAGLDEIADIAGDLHTIFLDNDASALDVALAAADLIVGTDFNNKGQKQALNAINGGADPTKRRVYLRKETKEKIKENAPKTPDGKYIDPNTLKPIDGPYDIGHKKGQEWHRRKKMHQERGSTRKEVRDAENDPSLYQIEDRSSNRSRKYEKKN